MKKQPKNKVLFLIPVGVILAGAVIFLCTRGNENDSVCKENVARLQALENSDISQTEEQLQALKQTTGISSGSDASDGSGSTLLSDVEIRQVFAGNVIIGDSITESIVEYGYLDTDVVVSKRGLNVGAADDQISTAIALNPSHVFMAFGSNDLEIYGSASSEFIDAYRTQIKKIQTALPDVPIISTAFCRLLMKRSHRLLILDITLIIMKDLSNSVRKWDVPLLTIQRL